ncbi:DUF1240 domain-containing protein [Morganella morganii]|uniref:DUF1240 domain-containing protein n=1 Tax=Morganella morganii TaxID=582 RepID=UPI0009B9C6DD
MSLCIFYIRLAFAYYFFIYYFHVWVSKKTQRINRKLSNLFSVFAILGIVFSFVFSFYVEYDLTSHDYIKCYKKSLLAPTEYVISKDMCK